MMETLTFLSEDNQHSKICSHCAIPFVEEELMQDFESTIKISSSSSREFLLQALVSIFKLNYLNPFDVQNYEEELANFELCQHCTQALVHLHQLYNTFTQLGKLDCYLDKKLQQLERIINHHQDKTINCDLISPPPQQESILEVRQKASSSSENNCKNNSHRSKNLLGSREPIILLKKLPAKYLQQIKNSNSPSEEDENYPELYPEVKMEVEDDFPMDHDYSPPSSPQDSDYNEKPIKNKSTKQGRGFFRRKKIVKKSSSPTKLNSKKRSNSLKKSGLSLKDTIKGHLHWSKYLIRKSNFANPCWYCKKHFETLDLCIQHTQEAHLPKIEDTESIIICPRCSKICIGGDAGHERHLKKCQVSVLVGVTIPKQFKCPGCPKVFAVETLLQDHLKSHSDQRPFACDECPYQAKCVKSLNSHKLCRHIDDPNEPKIKCDECPSYVKTARHLHIHKLKMHDPAGHQKYRKRQEALKVQYREKKKGVNVPPPVTFCEDCNVDFFSRRFLFNHRRKLHGDNMGKEYGCEKCGKYFTHLCSLRGHMQKVHTDERPFMCDQCGKGFKCSGNLRSHKHTVHTEHGRERINQKVRERTQRLKIIASQLSSVHNPS